MHSNFQENEYKQLSFLFQNSGADIIIIIFILLINPDKCTLFFEIKLNEKR